MINNRLFAFIFIFLLVGDLYGQELTNFQNRHQKKLCRKDFVVDTELFKDDTVYYECGLSSEQIALYLDNKYLSIIRKRYRKFCIMKNGDNYQIFLFELKNKYRGKVISEEMFLATPTPNYYAKIQTRSQFLIVVVGYVEQLGANQTVSFESVERIRWIMQQTVCWTQRM